ncbi:MAG: tetratricopeptide repeat protein [Armatimonadota bacterium]|nr:tetratricopeptide repeat protein [Armatimonadota bacterium]
MDRRDLADILSGAAVLVAFELLWMLLIRDIWPEMATDGGTARRLAVSALVIGFHVLGPIAAALVATRTLSNPPQVWRRLFPVAGVGAIVLYSISLSMRGPAPDLWVRLRDVGGVLVAFNMAYVLMWVAVRVRAEVSGQQSAAPAAETVPVYRRPGVMLWTAILVGGIALMVLPGMARSAAEQRAWELLADAGELDQALATAQHAVEVAPGCHYSWWSLGAVRLDRGEYAEAEEAFRRAIELKPREPGLHYGLAGALAMQGATNEAIAEYRQVLRAGRGETETRLRLGMLLLHTGEWDEAMTRAREVLKADPSSAYAHYILGYALDATGDTDQAVTTLREAIELKPDYAESHAALALSLTRQGKLDEAEAEARQAIELSDGLASPHLTLGRILTSQKEYEAALEHFRTAEGIEPDNAWAHHCLGVTLRTLDQLEEAVSEHRQAAELDPDNPHMAKGFAETLRVAGRIEEATAEYCRAAELSPDDPAIIGRAAHSLIQIGAVDEAVEFLQGLEGRTPDSLATWLSAQLAVAHIFRGDVAEARQRLAQEPPSGEGSRGYLARATARTHLGEWEKALAEIERARSTEAPGDGGSGTEAAALAFTGRLEEAEDVARQALQPSPKYCYATTAVLAYALAVQGRDEEARSLLADIQSSLEWEYAAPEALYYGGLAYHELGETERSDALFQRAIDRWPKHPWSVKMREMTR